MTSAICYLVHHTEESVSSGVQSLALLQANYLRRFPVPVVLFHEAGLTDAMRDRLAHAGPPVTFAPVDFSSYAPDLGATVDVEGMPCRTGYMHMCRFFANEIFHHPALADVDYYCRLDTDSFIHSPIDYDLFERARQLGAYYGFLNDSIRDHPSFYRGLWETAQQFLDLNPTIPTYAKLYRDVPEGRLYYTNFEVCYLPWFQHDPWRRFFHFINEAGGIYTHRWGDHTIRFIGVRLFMPSARIWRYPYVHYSHQGMGVGCVEGRQWV